MTKVVLILKLVWLIWISICIDSLTNQSKANESLASQVTELKSVLARREENHKKQQQLIRSLAEDAKSKLETANFYRSTMNNELNLSKGDM